MKISPGVLAVIASLGLFVAFAYAERNSSDPGVQKDSSSSRQQTDKPELTSDPQTVKKVQQALMAHGYDAGPADGTWRENTEISLKLYQQEQGMEATGRLDRMTLAALGFPGGEAAGGSSGQQDRGR